MSSSLTYASYLAGNTDNPYHLNHIYEFTELATMIAKEQIELYLPQIESMVNREVHSAISSALARTSKAMDVDIKRIVDVTCKELHAQFHSEELSHFVADTLKVRLEEALKQIDVKLIVN